jgi:hypothetical protein
MMHTPLSKNQASEIAEDFEDLIDTDFTVNKSLSYFIDNVLISPYNMDDKKLFVSNFHFSKDKDAALSFYSGSEYDVILLAYDVDDESSYIYIDIRTFVEQRGINYNFPG